MKSIPTRRSVAASLILLVTSALAIGIVGTIATFSAEMRQAHQRVTNRSETIPTSFGRLEYSTAGSGAPLLMMHGTGGGFDQGLSFSEKIMARGHRIIAPSRFGYLRSDFPADPSSENQADALAELLDKLDLDRVAVAGGSAGAQAALQFALRHPTRCDALILIVPATYVPGRPPVAVSALQEFIIQRALYSDFVFWAARNIMPIQLVRTLLATDQAVLEAATPSERARAYRILDELMPVSQRSRGMFNDAKLAGNPAPVDVSELRVPVLIISVEDDRFGTAAAARHLAQEIKGAKLVLYSSGGHIWLGHNEDLAAEVHAFLSSLQ